MEEILALLPKVHVIFIDYSCSLLPYSLAYLPPEKLKTLGGRKRTHKKKTKKIRLNIGTR
jgi:hypothetical protein